MANIKIVAVCVFGKSVFHIIFGSSITKPDEYIISKGFGCLWKIVKEKNVINTNFRREMEKNEKVLDDTIPKITKERIFVAIADKLLS